MSSLSKTLLTVAATMGSATATATLFSEDTHTQHYMFDTFVREFNKHYATSDEAQNRFQNFVHNLKVADERNQAERKNNGTAVHGINRFMDLTQQEFKDNYLGSKPVPNEEDKSGLKTVRTSVAAASGSSTSVDWTGTLTTPVKDQVHCTPPFHLHHTFLFIYLFIF